MKNKILALLFIVFAFAASVWAQVPSVPPPAGFALKLAYFEDFTKESDINRNVWNTTSGSITLDSVNGLSLDGTNASLVAANDNITQQYGVWEWLAKYPHNDMGEANGYHTDLYLGNAQSQFSTIYIEDDACENSIQFTGPTNCQNAINDTFDSANPSRGKQTFRTLVPNNGSGSPPIGDAFHVWDVAWLPDNSVSDYFDGAQQPNTVAHFTNSSWQFGARPLMTNRSCESSSNCNPTGNNPLFVKSFGVWRLVPVVATPQPTPQACVIGLSVASQVTSPVTFAPVVTGCPGWPAPSGFVRVEQTSPFPVHFDGAPGTASTQVSFGNGTYGAYVTLWANMATQIGGQSNGVGFTVGPSGPTPTPTNVPPTPTPTSGPPTPTPAVTPTPIPLAGGYYVLQLGTGDLLIDIPNPTGTATPPPTPTPQPTSTPVPVAGVWRANDVLNTFGVTSHVVQSLDTPAQWQTAMNYLVDMRHNRDDFTADIYDSRHLIANFFCAMHASMGTTFVGRCNAGDTNGTFNGWDQLAQCGAAFLIEGANEPNNFPFSFNGQSCNWSPGGDGSGCAPWQKALFTQAKADANLTSIPLLTATEVGAMTSNDGQQFTSGFADVANLHNYVWPNNHSLTDNAAWNAEDPDNSINSVDGMKGEFIDKTWRNGYTASPIGSGQAMTKVTTETGWPSNVGQTEDQRGQVIVDVLLDGALRNWAYTFIYQLIDDNDLFGLFDKSVNPKLAATYLHNLITIIEDKSSGFTPIVPTTSFAPQPPTMHSLLAQKSNGTYELIIWDESWATLTQTTVTINTGKNNGGNVYDVTQGSTPVSTFAGGTLGLSFNGPSIKVVEFK